MGKVLTVFTPTYNRKGLLSRLYKSLCSQTNKSFIWLIVDDGSDDGSKEIIDDFISEKIIDIQYHYQNNSGKYIAHNKGVTLCTTDLFVCVDSDDELYPFAVERTIDFWEKVKLDNSIAGIVSPKDMNGYSYFTNPPTKDTLMHLYDSKHLFGETMLVYRTAILQDYLFPEIKDEKFMSEIVIYYQIDNKYFLAVQNEYLYRAEYQQEGLTNNIEKIHWRNPYSTLLMYRTIASLHNNTITGIKACSCYFAWKKKHGIKDKAMVKGSISLLRIIGGTILFPHYYMLFVKKGKEYLVKE